MSADLLRNLSLLVPLAALLAVVAAQRSRVLPRAERAVTAAFLAAVLTFTGVLAVEAATSWWTFAPGPTSYAGIPLETVLGWAIAWGALPALVGGPLLAWLAGLAWLDLLLMPRLEPLVVLGPGWWAGEALLLGAVALPALLLGRATRLGTTLGLRASLQVVVFGTLLCWVVPDLAFAHDSGSWSQLLDQGLIVRTGLLAAALAVAVPGLAAVAELARVGRGTPFPWDPPERLVTTGPYAYVANPMQLSAVGLLVVLGLGTGSVVLVGGAGIAVVFCVVLAERHERAVLGARWPGHAAYRSEVRNWLPRWRPYAGAPATLWVSDECGLCRAVGHAVGRLASDCLELRAAEDAGVRLTRMRWVGPVDPVDRGLAAFARGLECGVLATAWLGWLIRLPVVLPALQAVADACGLGPRSVRQREETR